MDQVDPKFEVGQVVMFVGEKKALPFRVLDRKFVDGAWYYQWNRNNYANENMLRALTDEEKG